MKFQSLMGNVMLMLLTAILFLQCKKVAKESSSPEMVFTSKPDLQNLQSWFNANWNPVSSSTATARGEGADTIPWDLVSDRIRRIIPQWNLGRGYAYGVFTLYEVPVTLPNDMLLKSMPLNMSEGIDTLSEISPGSVSYLIVRESGQERVGEIMTIIPTYEYLQVHGYDVRNINLHFNAIYQAEDLGLDFSGRIIFHDQTGKLMREVVYARGMLTNISRHDPSDAIGVLSENTVRAPAECEIITVVWRECNSLVIEGSIISEICTPWVPIGTYQVGSCGGGGNTSDAGTYNPSGFTSGDDGPLSCKSFNFKKISATTNWQEAGVRGLQLVGDWFGTWGGFSVKRFGDVFVGLPVKTGDGTIITPGRAAEAAAEAANYAGRELQKRYLGMPRHLFDAIPASAIALDFRLLMETYLKNLFGADCKVNKYQTGPGTIIKNAVWNNGLFGGGGPCN